MGGRFGLNRMPMKSRCDCEYVRNGGETDVMCRISGSSQNREQEDQMVQIESDLSDKGLS